MKKRFLYYAGVPVLLAVLGACGSPETVQTGSAGARQAAASPAAAAATTTTVAPAAKDTFLYDVPVVEDTGDIPTLHGPIKVNAVVYQNSTYQNLSCATQLAWDFDLNRGYKHLQALAGVSDTSLAADKVTFVVKADGAQKASVAVALGQTQPLDVDLTNVLRLRIEVTRSGGDRCERTMPIGTLVTLADAKLSK